MVNNTVLFVAVDILLVLISAYFGLKAVKMWKKCSVEDIFKMMSEDIKHKMRLFYSSLFLGVMMATLSVVHALQYVMERPDIGAVDAILTSLLFLSIVILTHSWHVFLKDAACCRIE